MNTKGVSSLIIQNRLLSQAKSRMRNSSAGIAAAAKSNSGNNNALVDSLKNKANQSSYGLSEAQEEQKETYTSMQKAAESVRSRSEKLLSWPSKTWEEMTDEEKAKYKTDAVAEVTNLVSDYNLMIASLKDAGGTVDGVYLKQMKGYFQNAQKQLEELGITADADGKLSVNKEKLEGADALLLKAAFGEEGTFVDDIGKRAENVIANAKTNLALINKNQYAGNYTYNKYGSDIFDVLAGGSQYSSKG
ncbi:MAG: hypothetical protein Q4D94_02225 [Bacillota bacterium]|nr:hypothetical protein [Bacillota bacterium]